MVSSSTNVYKQSRRSEENAIVLRLEDPTSTRVTRMTNSLTIPNVLKRSHPLTEEEQNGCGYTILRNEKVVMIFKVGKKEKEIGFYRWLSPAVVSQHPALWNLLQRMQYILVNPVYIEHMQSSYPSWATHLADKGHTHNVGFSVSIGHHAEGIHMGHIAKKGDEITKDLNCLMAEVHQQCVEMTGLKVDYKQHWATNASVTGCHHQNYDCTSAQINYVAETADMKESLKCKAHVHVDPNDDPARFTVLPFLNTTTDAIYDGILNLTAARLNCSGQSMGVSVFSGRQPHAGSGFGPIEPEFDVSTIDKSNHAPQHMYQTLPPGFFKGRISVPIYPKLDNIIARAKELSPELWTDQALTVFGTRRNHADWKMRSYVKENYKEIIASGVTAVDLCKRFEFEGESKKVQLPDQELAQMCLQYGGQKDSELEDTREAALYAGCGVFIPQSNKDGTIKDKKRK